MKQESGTRCPEAGACSAWRHASSLRTESALMQASQRAMKSSRVLWRSRATPRSPTLLTEVRCTCVHSESSCCLRWKFFRLASYPGLLRRQADPRQPQARGRYHANLGRESKADELLTEKAPSFSLDE